MTGFDLSVVFDPTRNRRFQTQRASGLAASFHESCDVFFSELFIRSSVLRGSLVSIVVSLFLFVSVLEANDLKDLIKIYGSLRPEVIGRFPKSGDQVRRMDDGYSRVGVKGRAKLSDTLSGFYKYERRVSANDGQDDGAVRSDNNELRQVHVGLDGNFGSVSIGRHYGLYYDYIDDELDRHRSHYSDAIVFGDLFVSNSVVYSSPEFSGFNFGMLVELNDADSQGTSIDERFEIVGTFRHQGFAVHAGYVNSPFHNGLFGVASSYGYRSVKLTGIYQRLQVLNNEDDTLVSGAVDVDLTEHNSIRLAVTRKQNNMNMSLDEVPEFND
jgi:predicted porin